MDNNEKMMQMTTILFETEYVKRMRSHFPLMDVANLNYIRVGRDFDGGYVMADDFSGVKNVYSCGVDHDVSWDIDFLNKTMLRGGSGT